MSLFFFFLLLSRVSAIPFDTRPLFPALAAACETVAFLVGSTRRSIFHTTAPAPAPTRIEKRLECLELLSINWGEWKPLILNPEHDYLMIPYVPPDSHMFSTFSRVLINLKKSDENVKVAIHFPRDSIITSGDMSTVIRVANDLGIKHIGLMENVGMLALALSNTNNLDFQTFKVYGHNDPTDATFFKSLANMPSLNFFAFKFSVYQYSALTPGYQMVRHLRELSVPVSALEYVFQTFPNLKKVVILLREDTEMMLRNAFDTFPMPFALESVAFMEEKTSYVYYGYIRSFLALYKKTISSATYVVRSQHHNLQFFFAIIEEFLSGNLVLSSLKLDLGPFEIMPDTITRSPIKIYFVKYLYLSFKASATSLSELLSTFLFAFRSLESLHLQIVLTESLDTPGFSSLLGMIVHTLQPALRTSLRSLIIDLDFGFPYMKVDIPELGVIGTYIPLNPAEKAEFVTNICNCFWDIWGQVSSSTQDAFTINGMVLKSVLYKEGDCHQITAGDSVKIGGRPVFI